MRYKDVMRMQPAEGYNMIDLLDAGLDYQMFCSVTLDNNTPEFHSHDYYELYFFGDGNVSMYIEEYAFDLHPGDMVLLPPERMHRAVFHDSASRYERRLMYIRREALLQLSVPGLNLLATLDDCARRAQFHHTLSSDQYHIARQLFDETLMSEPDRSPYQQLLTRSRAAMLVAHVCKWLTDSPSAATEPSKHRMADIIAYINEHLSGELSLDAIAARFFISKYHLLREFKGYTNRTVYQYIISKRIMMAKQRMRQGENPSEIYQPCGFQDYSSFYKAFKKETGLSPKQFASG